MNPSGVSEEEHSRSLYIRFSPKLRVKKIKIRGNHLIVITHSVVENQNDSPEKWTKIVFRLKYDLFHSSMVDTLDDLGYNEFKDRVTVIDFLKIKSFEKEVWQFFPLETLLKTKIHRRLLNVENIDDIHLIESIFRTRISKYESLLGDKEIIEENIERGKASYITNKMEYKKWKSVGVTNF